MQSTDQNKQRWHQVLGCCCLAPAVFSALLLIGGVLAFFLVKDTLAALAPVMAYKALEYIAQLGTSFVRGFLGI